MELTTVPKPAWELKDVARADEWFLVGADNLVYLILASYLAFVLVVGPYLMRNRPPFKLARLLLVYNVTQMVASVFLCQLAFRLLYSIATAEEKCVNDSKELQYTYFYALHMYFLAKLSELLDTVFFVLRKKTRQISFLHVYHHSAVFMYSWGLMAYEKAFVSVAFIGSLNSLVHLIMYSYYALSVFPALAKYLWWKKYITKIQMIQFSVMIVFIVFEFSTSPCELPKSLATHLLLNLSLVFALFVNFYRKTYTPQKLKNS